MWSEDKDNEKLEGEVLETCGTSYYLKGINYILDMYMQLGFTNYINA